MDRPLPRVADPVIAEVIAHYPAVMIIGPRACGKTTSAMRHAREVVRLDVRREAVLFEADPDAGLATFAGRPLLLDEWQQVPGVVGAVKRAVDAGAASGSFILTGSAGAVSAGAWPGTGRIIEVDLAPLTLRELRGRTARPSLIARIAAGEVVTQIDADAPDITGYVDIALAGGFPEPAITLPPDARSRWYANYARNVARRDVTELLRRGDPARVGRYLQAFALNSGGICDHQTIYNAAGIKYETAVGYESALRSLRVIELVPPWTSNRVRRLTKSPKRFVVDSALMAAAADVDRHAIITDGDLLGRLLETLVYAQIAPELTGALSAARLFHLRKERGTREVDLLIELTGGRIIAMEIKATAAPSLSDAKHLAWLRDELGERFVRGVVFHTGPYAFPLGDRIDALPICALWS